MKKIPENWIFAASLVLFICGVAASVAAIRAVLTASADIEQAQALNARLSMLEGKLADVDRAKVKLQKVSTSNPPDLDSVIDSSGLRESLSDSSSQLVPLGEGWTALNRELVFNDVVLADVDSFAAACSALKPPFIVTGLSVRASPFESGRGRVTLSLQSLRSKSN